MGGEITLEVLPRVHQNFYLYLKKYDNTIKEIKLPEFHLSDLSLYYYFFGVLLLVVKQLHINFYIIASTRLMTFGFEHLILKVYCICNFNI